MSLTLHTTMGDIKVELHCAEAPRTCFNFLALAATGYYDGTKFHRNIPGFMVQGGDPTGRGKGGESVWGGKFEDEFNAKLTHSKRGILSMANRGANTNGSQFFFTYDAAPHLNNVYTVFGHALHGFPVLDAIEKAPVGKKNRPLNDIVLERITIHANPLAA